MRVSTTSALAAGAFATLGAAAENYLGFNSGATKPDNSAKFKEDFLAEFTTAQGLEGAPGKFDAVRLYTNVQAYSTNDPIQAFDAAVETKTKILLGVWTSGTDSIDNEVTALKSALSKYGKKLSDLIIGVSIGSEDLYRISVTGLKNDPEGVGAGPDVIIKFIKEFKAEFADSTISDVPIGHVDTWDSWTNGTNKAVIDAVDWIGVDEYPYYESGKDNTIKNSGTLFDKAYDATIAAAGGKPVWVTETGYPYTGIKWGDAVASVDNAEYYWQEVGCRRLFNKTPTFWYNLRDSNGANKQSFAITNNLSTTPRFNLTCPDTFDTPSSTSSSAGTSTGTATKQTSTATSGSDASSTGVVSPTSSAGAGSGSDSGSTSSSASGSNTPTETGAEGGAATQSVVPGSGASSLTMGATFLVAVFGAVFAFF
ncbi:glycoside hydrolase superfamily [Xylaria bambusicola]|uniref:glycoside hydrolase superfamily n=1 Tax=Xylaria bambusicola TaxID=326684 RepID=UPI0020086779|nr:glycoside hydrolase superfamily [Xylaria bambusicola]KAI0502897.1 glycoside hydrolase superfamily [Xylaria bambusicola]